MASPGQGGQTGPARGDEASGWRARAAQVVRARISLPVAVIGLAVIVFAGTALAVVLAARNAPPPAAAPPALTPAEAATSPPESPTAPLAAPTSHATPTLLVARPAPYPTGLQTPVSRAGTAASGAFELGGQVEHDLRRAGRMQQAGMTWVRYEVPWRPGLQPRQAAARVEEAHRAGFKVLLAVTGESARPAEIDVAAYLDFLERLAYYEPDAIEIWSEPNSALRWPQGQLDGAVYVRDTLAPAYNAIKAVDSGIMVVSAPLQPSTGGCTPDGCGEERFLEQMSAAGARNYLDCAGVRHLGGSEAPSAGGALGQRVSLYADALSHPVCLVQFGYLSGEGYGALWGGGGGLGQGLGGRGVALARRAARPRAAPSGSTIAARASASSARTWC